MERRLLLVDSPLSVGEDWAHSLCRSTRRQGRSIAGGWPGTMLEARERIARHLRERLAQARWPALTREELIAATSATYARAKKTWLEAEHTEKAETRRQVRSEG